MEDTSGLETSEITRERISASQGDEDDSVSSGDTLSSSLSFWDEWDVGKPDYSALESLQGSPSELFPSFDLEIKCPGITPAGRCEQTTSSEPSTQEHLRSLTGDDVPSFKTSWKINPEKPCCNFFILDSRVVPEEERECKAIMIPAELASSVNEMHSPQAEETQGLVTKIFENPRKRYTYGSFFRVHPDQWTVFWDPGRMLDLTTLTVQSFICAALNSRRQLTLVLGVDSSSKIIGCDWSEEARETMRKQFEFCVSREFVPALDDDICHFRFHPVYNEEGHSHSSLYIAVISVKDRVEEVYQLSSGRFYYVDGKKVMQTRSISEVMKRVSGHREARSSSSHERTDMKFTPRLGEPVNKQESFATWSLRRIVMYVLPGLLITLLSYKYVPK
ncbi:hypothetical protein V3C99_005361 [Haemonchus contortus]